MITLEAAPVLALATVVYAIWRIAVARRRGLRPVREVAAALTFGWALVVVFYAFFPLRVIFYDWHGRFSLVPLASIRQLLTETTPQLAFRNIVGNLLLLAPFGVLLPVLYPALRRLGPLLLRGAAISVAIETLQLASRARAVDIDDVLLNSIGVAGGWLLWRLGAAAARRTATGSRLLISAEDAPPGEPLRHALVPVVVTLVITTAVFSSMVIDGTIGSGPDGIDAAATLGMDDGKVVAAADAGVHRYMLATAGTGADERVQLTSFERVLPGRFTPQVLGEPRLVAASFHQLSVTAYNPTAGELPSVFIWGVNRVGATTLVVRGHGLDERVALPDTGYLLVGFVVDALLHDDEGILQPFDLRFLDADGVDISGELPSLW